MGGHWSVQIGGAQYQVQCILDELAKRPEFETYFLANLTPEKLDQGTYQIVRIGFRRRFAHLRMLPNLPSLYGALQKLKPDVIYQRELMSFTGACGLYAQRHGARFVFHLAHDNDARKLRRRGWRPGAINSRLERAISVYGMLRATAIVAQTEDQVRLLKSNYGLDAAAVVRNFQPIPSEYVAKRDPTRLKVIWVANFKDWKHPELFVELASALRNRPEIDFVMIGRAGPEKIFGKLYERIKGVPKLSYLGEQPLARVNEEIASSHVFVNTSASEGFANTFIQAWLRGVPVVSCFVDPDGCLTKGGAGVVAGSLNGLISVIEGLASNRTRLAELSEAARAYAYRNHTPESAHKLLNLLAGL